MTSIDSSRRESLARSGLTVLSWTRKIPVDIWSLSGSDSLSCGSLRSGWNIIPLHGGKERTIENRDPAFFKTNNPMRIKEDERAE
ncbi:hypothetical protein I7I50_01115 [Histoplasma capsulatum G186AR]|uniref:Uncharacterized protein n=1 Tax=Ajellomyces capsulatus TaxID=5037 RepID=A0A8H8D3Y2_AJECA|nr:hypothetical protein I7I52_09062 [Histoplasma capsulatum]QSS73083.1 hypothetical protein I7I50_01115 [Histoplasma capsulatum G186AR]